MLFSLIMVTLNAGDGLAKSLESALCQTCRDFEIIVKDGGSSDDSFEQAATLLADERVRVVRQPDEGIYDAMNQAVAMASGEYIYFLNAGDWLWKEDTLERAACILREEKQDRLVAYGNIFNRKTDARVTPSPVIDGFTCYRNVPCHQSCFYSASLCKEKAFETNYKIRADYEHFLWCFYKGNAVFRCFDQIVASYEGGGFSETKENKARSGQEHKAITRKYMPAGKRFLYRLAMICTLAPLRRFLANHKAFSTMYNRFRDALYRRKK